jgi:glutathionylspermidine synthase
MRDAYPDADQFNSIHERLIDAWAAAAGALAVGSVTFTCLGDNVEDFMTVSYLRDTAMQAGLDARFTPIERVGWDERRRHFVDEDGRPIRSAFKLYPWEWMAAEAFGRHLPLDTTRWIEPLWKMLLSNKRCWWCCTSCFPNEPVPAAGLVRGAGGAVIDVVRA